MLLTEKYFLGTTWTTLKMDCKTETYHEDLFKTSPNRTTAITEALLLLLLLSHFSRVRLCATPETAAHQAPPSLGFSRQEYWSGLPFPSPMQERKSESEVAQSCRTLSDPMDCSPPGSSVHGIFQARVLEWGAIAFSTEALLSESKWIHYTFIIDKSPKLRTKYR